MLLEECTDHGTFYSDHSPLPHCRVPSDSTVRYLSLATGARQPGGWDQIQIDPSTMIMCRFRGIDVSVCSVRPYHPSDAVV